MESAIQLVPMMAIREVAWLLNVHTNTVRRWSNCGILRAYTINTRGDRRFRRDDVYLFLNEYSAHCGNINEISMTWR